MMTKVKRWLLRLMIFKLCVLSVLLPVREALAGLPLLAVPVAEFVGGLVVSSIGRQAIITVGVAANDASWLPVMVWVARAAGILGIATPSSLYEIPLQADVPVPVQVVPAVEGALGSYDNPLPYDSSRLKYTVNSFVAIAAAVSTDGLDHVWPAGVYTPVQMLEKCEQFMAVYSGAATAWPCGIQTDPNVVSWLSGRRGQAATSVKYQYVYSQAFYVTGIDFGVPSGRVVITALEDVDGVKRFARTANGFRVDTTDPDWTEQEKATYGNADHNLQWQSAQSTVTASVANSQTQIQTATQANADVRYRQLDLAADAKPIALTEQLLKDQTVAQVVANTSPGTNPGTDPGTIVFPTDYARKGEAASATAPVTQKLDVLHDDLTKTSTAAPDPTLSEGGIIGVFFVDTFKDLIRWTVPGHASECPTANINFDFFGQQFNLDFDSHCTILNNESVYSVAAVAFEVLWIVAALFIVLGA